MNLFRENIATVIRLVVDMGALVGMVHLHTFT